MLFKLLKKDFLIVKKYVFIMSAAVVIIPLFMLWQAPEHPWGEGFALAIIFPVYMLLQYLSLKEYQFPKAATLLCSMPFSRKMMVLSKYIFCVLMYVICCIIYGLVNLFIPSLGEISLEIYALVFFVLSVVIGIYLPVHYKFGYEKAKIVYFIVIVTSPVLIAYSFKFIKFNIDDFSVDNFSKLPTLVIYGGLVVLGFVILTISALLSVKIYENAELA